VLVDVVVRHLLTGRILKLKCFSFPEVANDEEDAETNDVAKNKSTDNPKNKSTDNTKKDKRKKKFTKKT
jgi:hypothetical protein